QREPVRECPDRVLLNPQGPSFSNWGLTAHSSPCFPSEGLVAVDRRSEQNWIGTSSRRSTVLRRLGTKGLEPSAVFLELRCARLNPTSHAKLVGAVLLAKLMFEIAFLSGNNGIADYEHRWDEHEDRPPAAKHQRECKVEERGRAVPRVTRKSVWPRGRKRFGGQSGWNGCADLPECCKLPADSC